MAADEKLVLSNCLCFAINKAHYLANKPFKSLLMDFYTTEELADAKTLLLNEIDALKVANFPKMVRRRRDSNGRNALDIDDIMAAITFLDENQLLSKLPSFVSNHPDKMPASRLVEGDFSIVWTKISNLEESINKAVNANLETNDMLKQNSDTIASLSVDVKAITTAINHNHSSRYAATCRPIDNVNAQQCGSKSNERVTGATAGRSTCDNQLLIAATSPTVTSAASFIHESSSVNNVVNTTTDTRQCSTWGSVASAVHIDGESDNDYETVTSRAQRRAEKRKERSSPSEHFHNADNPWKRVNDGSRCAAALADATARAHDIITGVRTALDRNSGSTRSVMVSPSSGRTSVKLTGQRSFSTLKAAERKNTELAVFCISNVGLNYTVNDIRSHSASLGARAIYCYEINSFNSDARSFKLAVASTNTNLITDELSWPHRVVVRTWRFKTHAPAGNVADAHDSTRHDMTHSLISSDECRNRTTLDVSSKSSAAAVKFLPRLSVEVHAAGNDADSAGNAAVYAGSAGALSMTERGREKEGAEVTDGGREVGGREDEEEIFMESIGSQTVVSDGLTDASLNTLSRDIQAS